MKQALINYGFSNETADKLLKGKTVTTAYGKVKIKAGTLETTYEDGITKKEKLW